MVQIESIPKIFNWKDECESGKFVDWTGDWTVDKVPCSSYLYSNIFGCIARVVTFYVTNCSS